MEPKKDEVHDFLAGYPIFMRDIAVAPQATVRSVIPDACKMLDPPGRITGYGFGAGCRDLVCRMIPSLIGVKLGIVPGAELPDPYGLLECTGKPHGTSHSQEFLTCAGPR